jgi:hypothetical protein
VKRLKIGASVLALADLSTHHGKKADEEQGNFGVLPDIAGRDGQVRVKG